jgi:hypothetical protein
MFLSYVVKRERAASCNDIDLTPVDSPTTSHAAATLGASCGIAVTELRPSPDRLTNFCDSLCNASHKFSEKTASLI